MSNGWFWINIAMALANTPFALKGYVFNAFCGLLAAFVAGWVLAKEVENGHR